MSNITRRNMIVGGTTALTGFAAASIAVAVQDKAVQSSPSESSKQSSAGLSSLKPHHVAISVPDFEEAIRWYQEKLGFKVVVKREFPSISTQAANLELNGFQVEIFARDKSFRAKPPAVTVPDDLLVQGVKHIALLVDDLDAAVAELKRRGVQLLDEPTRVEVLGLKLCFIKDNNGNLIELGQELNQKSR